MTKTQEGEVSHVYLGSLHLQGAKYVAQQLNSVDIICKGGSYRDPEMIFYIPCWIRSNFLQ
jgi:hypothetical protein